MFKNALQQNPNSGEARFFLGKALLDEGDARGNASITADSTAFLKCNQQTRASVSTPSGNRYCITMTIHMTGLLLTNT